MKNLYLIALMIIIAVAVDKIEDQISDDEFKQVMETFMNRGGRNTSHMGLMLCQRVNKLGTFHSIKPEDCDKIYQHEHEGQ